MSGGNKVVTPEQAEAMGYWSLTRPYRPKQKAMWERVCADMEKGGIPYALVRVKVDHAYGPYDGIEVWRG